MKKINLLSRHAAANLTVSQFQIGFSSLEGLPPSLELGNP